MAVVAPFRGVRYNPEKITHLEDVVTPPLTAAGVPWSVILICPQTTRITLS